MTELSTPQKEGLRQIVNLKRWMVKELNVPEDRCWFVQKSLNRVTWHTLQALRDKGFLEQMDYREEKRVVEYYRIVKGE